MFSKFFIERPVLANVIALFIILIGAVSLYALPVSQYPQITPPTVQVTTRYPGATARYARLSEVRDAFEWSYPLRRRIYQGWADTIVAAADDAAEAKFCSIDNPECEACQ